MTSPQTDPRVRRLHRRPWSRSLPTALGGGILIDPPIIRGTGLGASVDAHDLGAPIGLAARIDPTTRGSLGRTAAPLPPDRLA
jgi:hypothetical protein